MSSQEGKCRCYWDYSRFFYRDLLIWNCALLEWYQQTLRPTQRINAKLLSKKICVICTWHRWHQNYIVPGVTSYCGFLYTVLKPIYFVRSEKILCKRRFLADPKFLKNRFIRIWNMALGYGYEYQLWKKSMSEKCKYQGRGSTSGFTRSMYNTARLYTSEKAKYITSQLNFNHEKAVYLCLRIIQLAFKR